MLQNVLQVLSYFCGPQSALCYALTSLLHLYKEIHSSVDTDIQRRFGVHIHDPGR